MPGDRSRSVPFHPSFVLFISVISGLIACTAGIIDAGDGGPGDCPIGGCPEGMECVEGECLPIDPCRDVVCDDPNEVCSGGFCVDRTRDGDGDTFSAQQDCDDADPLVYPGSTRPCANGCGEGVSTCLDDGSWSECTFETDPCEADHAEATCESGACVIVACEAGWENCDGAAGNGCEDQLGTEENCSACDDACPDGQICQDGSCRCVPDCAGAECGADDGCGGRCDEGACPAHHVCDDGRCRCEPDCAGAECGADDGCGGRCQDGWCPGGAPCDDGVCRCVPDCGGAACGASDGCGGVCDGWCPEYEECRGGSCECPGPHYQRVGGVCVPSCGNLLRHRGFYDDGGGCCAAGCAPGVRQAGGPGETWDCTYCCEGNDEGMSCVRF